MDTGLNVGLPRENDELRNKPFETPIYEKNVTISDPTSEKPSWFSSIKDTISSFTASKDVSDNKIPETNTFGLPKDNLDKDIFGYPITPAPVAQVPMPEPEPVPTPEVEKDIFGYPKEPVPITILVEKLLRENLNFIK